MEGVNVERLLVDNGKQRLLLPGDLGGREEAMLVENGLPQTGIVVAGHQRADAGVGAEDPGAAHDRRQLFAFTQQDIDFRRGDAVIINIFIINRKC